MSVVGENFTGQSPGRRDKPKLLSVVAIVLACGVAALALSFVYAPLQQWVLTIWLYLNAALTFAMAWIIGKVAVGMVRRRRLDSPGLAFLAGAAGGCLAVWFCWVAYIYVLLDYQIEAYWHFLNPVELVGIIRALGDNPVWYLKKQGDMPWYLLYLLWLVEAGVLILTPAAMALDFVKTNRRCDRCGDWVKPTGDVAAFKLPAEYPQDLIERLTAGDVTPLFDLERRPAEGDEDLQWLEATGYACADCQDQDSLVTVNLVTLTYNKKSKNYDRRQKTLSQYVKVDVETEGKIFEPVPEAPRPEPVPVPAETSSEDKEEEAVE